MSKYTTELRYICEEAAGLTESVGYDGIDEVIALAAPKIFSFDFPIYDEQARLPLEKKILENFYTREICEETVGLWKLRLRTKLNRIMPYYNQIYLSVKEKYDPFNDVDITRVYNGTAQGSVNNTGTITNTGEGSNEQTTTGQNQGTNNSVTARSDTPQGGLTGLLENEYLTEAEKTDSNYTNNGNNTTKGKNNSKTTISNINAEQNKNEDSHTETIKGKQSTQSYAKLMMEYRKSLINVDDQVLRELEDLFFKLW